ncbi:MAG: hypothetical protein KAT71_00760 [Gammaproteobacteria bacterium]|nr:hypothetical protein [Gammaproteobacteria bacterium]
MYKYSKQALTVEQQLRLLKNQGLIVDDEQSAAHVLSVVGYYRLSGYLLPFKSNHTNTAILGELSKICTKFKILLNYT